MFEASHYWVASTFSTASSKFRLICSLTVFRRQASLIQIRFRLQSDFDFFRLFFVPSLQMGSGSIWTGLNRKIGFCLAVGTRSLSFFFPFCPVVTSPRTFASDAPANLNSAASLSSLERCLQHFSASHHQVQGRPRARALHSAASADAAGGEKKKLLSTPRSSPRSLACQPGPTNNKRRRPKGAKKPRERRFRLILLGSLPARGRRVIAGVACQQPPPNPPTQNIPSTSFKPDVDLHL